jgi:3-hydroxypropionate dehydrogenase (NADP+)
VVEEARKSKIVQQIDTTSDLSDVAGASYVQESVIENIDAKIRILKQLENYVREDTILASSTSGFPMSRMQSDLKHPERAIVVHPFNPPHLIPLVELVPGSQTSLKTLQVVQQLMARLGKVSVLVKKEVPGFAANRIQVAVIRECLDLIDKGVVSMEDIERIFYAGIGLRYATMGPFAIETVNGGPGGLETDFTHFKPALEEWLDSLVAWTTVPVSAQEKALSQVKNLNYLKTKSFEELVSWRDRQLIALLRLRGYSD